MVPLIIEEMTVTLGMTSDSGIRGESALVFGAGVITVTSVSVGVPDSRTVVMKMVVTDGIGDTRSPPASLVVGDPEPTVPRVSAPLTIPPLGELGDSTPGGFDSVSPIIPEIVSVPDDVGLGGSPGPPSGSVGVLGSGGPPVEPPFCKVVSGLPRGESAFVCVPLSGPISVLVPGG
jgi:hypothetical protein